MNIGFLCIGFEKHGLRQPEPAHHMLAIARRGHLHSTSLIEMLQVRVLKDLNEGGQFDKQTQGRRLTSPADAFDPAIVLSAALIHPKESRI